MSLRTLILALGLATFAPVGLVMSATAAPPEAYTLAPLPYATGALEPVIDQKTMEIHHDKHHAAYFKNLNQAVAADPALQGQSLEALLANASRLPAAVRNNGGGHYNPTLFWTLMAPVGQGGEPSAALRARIDQDFGS